MRKIVFVHKFCEAYCVDKIIERTDWNVITLF